MTVHHYYFRNFVSFFKCRCKNHQALWWNCLSWGPPEEWKTQLPLLQKTSSLELPASEIAAHINASQSSSNRHISISTVQRRLLESGLMVELLQRNHYSILQRYAIPSGLRLVGLSFVFQQDNAPTHTAMLCKGDLTKNESDGVLYQMTWPSQSPNLNPIEMVWDELDCRLKEKQPTSAQHVWELLQDCWKSILCEAGWENAKSVQSYHQGKGWLLLNNQNIKYILT